MLNSHETVPNSNGIVTNSKYIVKTRKEKENHGAKTVHELFLEQLEHCFASQRREGKKDTKREATTYAFQNGSIKCTSANQESGLTLNMCGFAVRCGVGHPDLGGLFSRRRRVHHIKLDRHIFHQGFACRDLVRVQIH